MYTLPGLELGRFRRHRMARLAILVIAVIPALYGCLYLASNWEPTEHIDRLDAAIVNEDVSAPLPDSPDGTPGGTLSAGADLTEELTTSDDAGFTWTAEDEVSAQQGLADGRYVAVLRIPRNFSSDIASAGEDHPQRAQLTLHTDDAHNYIVGTIAKQVLESVRMNLNETVTGDYVDQVYLGFNEIQAKMSEASDGANQVADGASDLKDGTGELTTGTGEARKGSDELANGLDQLSDGADQLSSGADELSDGASKLADGTATAADKSGDLADGAQQVADGTGQLATTADEVNDKAQDVRDRVDAFDKEATPIIEANRKALADARETAGTDLREKVDTLAERYPDDPDVQALADSLDSYLDTLDEYADQAAAAADRLEAARTNIRKAVDAAAAKVNAAASAMHRLDDGATKVSDGAHQLHDGLTTLDDGAQRLDDGAATLRDGAAKLATASDTAATGGHRLADGLVTLDDGAQRLDEGANELKSGSRELADGIAEGATQVPTYSAQDRATRSGVVAVPVEGSAERDHAVQTYGEGLAPFFLSLALWIGGMITYMVINAVPYRALASSARSWRIAWSGYAPGIFFGALQVAVIFIVLPLTLDFTVPSWLATVGFAMLVAASFHAIHQLCIVALGTIGRLVALVLLMLQIGAAGGTYPIATTPAFFQAISPFLPMTYAVQGMRGLIAGGNTMGVVHAALMLLLFGVIALAASAFIASRKRVLTVSRLYPSLEV